MLRNEQSQPRPCRETQLAASSKSSWQCRWNRELAGSPVGRTVQRFRHTISRTRRQVGDPASWGRVKLGTRATGLPASPRERHSWIVIAKPSGLRQPPRLRIDRGAATDRLQGRRTTRLSEVSRRMAIQHGRVRRQAKATKSKADATAPRGGHRPGKPKELPIQRTAARTTHPRRGAGP